MQDYWKFVELHVETLYSSWNSCRIWRLRISTGISLPLFFEKSNLSSPLLWKIYLVKLEFLKLQDGFESVWSALKRCKYRLYSDTMLNIWCVLNETDTDVHMYIEFISSWCSHIAVQVEYDILNRIYTGLYTNIWIDWIDKRSYERTSQMSLN